jgi:uncharacterized membrane protein
MQEVSISESIEEKKPNCFNMITYKRRYLIYAHALFCIILQIISHVVGVGSVYVFLVWNLFLAYIPWLLVRNIYRVKEIGHLIILLLAWLFFLPNAPYLVTDFVHLKPSSGEGFWLDLTILFSFAINGLIIGFMSIFKVYQHINVFLGERFAIALTAVALGLSGYGIYLGRVLRWNSWDVLLNPFELLSSSYRSLFPIAQNTEAWLFSALFATFLAAHYYAFQYLTNKINVK